MRDVRTDRLLESLSDLEPRLRRAARRRGTPQVDVEDALQETWLRCLRAARGGRIPSLPDHLRSWFSKVFWREVARIRSRRRRFDVPPPRPWPPLAPYAPSSGDPTARMIEAWRALGFTRRDRRAIHLVLVEGRSVAEAARRTGRSERTVQRRIHAAWRAAFHGVLTQR